MSENVKATATINNKITYIRVAWYDREFNIYDVGGWIQLQQNNCQNLLSWIKEQNKLYPHVKYWAEARDGTDGADSADGTDGFVAKNIEAVLNISAIDGTGGNTSGNAADLDWLVV